MRVRQDMTKHIGDIAGKYLIPGETQESALMFVPSESVYAELYEGFDDVVQRAYNAKIVIVSPSLLMIAIHVIQQVQKDARMREAAGQIQAEVGKLIGDVERSARARSQAARAFQSSERRCPADRDVGRKGDEAWRANRRGGV